MGSIRSEIVKNLISSTPRTIEFPHSHDNNRNPLLLSEIFGSNVFSMQQMQLYLPKPTYKRFLDGLTSGKMLSRDVADAISHAVKVWAQARGATHYTHWFQPQTNQTAEKHDSFLSLKVSDDGYEVTPLDTFSGSALAQAEPDASSFPHGGSRTTFEARGYTVWDPTSPMFLRQGPHGTYILYIPSVFISYNGDALDEKTGLLRSTEMLGKAAVQLMQLIGKEDVTRVTTTLGTEQEFFLVDRGTYAHRLDLRMTGRSLVGRAPPKHQQLEDHYFAQIPSRVLAAISEAELELWKLGIPIKTRHNEVAPRQFEMAPIFENANLAIDHNLLTMDVLHRVAHRHKLKVLFHEKPFKGVNGSGKHCNWSMSTNTGLNLLDPSETPEKNPVFLCVLLATLKAVYSHAGLLRASIASASNDHRLGAHEAPPAIVSVFLGQHLNEVLNSIEEKRPVKQEVRPHMTEFSLGSRTLDVKVSTLPEISRDTTDRNRTSPFAFTGNKFEFRAVGSKQSPSFPMTILNAAVSWAILEMVQALTTKKEQSGGVLSMDSILDVIRVYIKDTKQIRFEGNNYSQEWADQAAKLSLLNLKSAPECFDQLLELNNKSMLTSKCKVFTESELNLRYHVLMEKYSKDLIIESRTIAELMKQYILPAAFKYRLKLSKSMSQLESLKIRSDVEREMLDTMSTIINNGNRALHKLEEWTKHIDDLSDDLQKARQAKELVPLMADVRAAADAIEEYVPDEIYPFPKYYDILF